MTDTRSRERWADVPGWEELYQVSDRGRVRRAAPGRGTRSGRVLIPGLDSGGYPFVVLSAAPRRKWMRVHRLVLLAWVGPCPEGSLGLHRNGDRGDNGLDNLYYGSQMDNMRDAREHGTLAVGEKHGNSQLTEALVRTIRRRTKIGVTQAELSRELGVSNNAVHFVVHGRTWGHVA